MNGASPPTLRGRRVADRNSIARARGRLPTLPAHDRLLDGAVRVVAKPDELLALHDVTAEMFDTLKRWFSVPDRVTLDMTAVDAVVHEMADPVMIAALAMRKLQALNLLATPGVRTSTDVVVTIVQDLARALLQAPAMRLRVQAERTDWDAALADLADSAASDGEAVERAAPLDPDDVDEEAERFEVLHAMLHLAVQAVVEASDGEIVYLE